MDELNQSSNVRNIRSTRNDLIKIHSNCMSTSLFVYTGRDQICAICAVGNLHFISIDTEMNPKGITVC